MSCEIATPHVTNNVSLLSRNSVNRQIDGKIWSALHVLDIWQLLVIGNPNAYPIIDRLYSWLRNRASGHLYVSSTTVSITTPHAWFLFSSILAIADESSEQERCSERTSCYDKRQWELHDSEYSGSVLIQFKMEQQQVFLGINVIFTFQQKIIRRHKFKKDFWQLSIHTFHTQTSPFRRSLTLSFLWFHLSPEGSLSLHLIFKILILIPGNNIETVLTCKQLNKEVQCCQQ